MIWFFNQLAHLPLPVLHRLGTILGWLTYFFSQPYAERLRINLKQALKSTDKDNADFVYRKVLHANISEAGKAVMELPWVWRRPLDQVVTSVKQCHGWEHFESAHAHGKGVIVLTPHYGCFELISLYVAARTPMTCMYRRPRWDFLNTLMHEGRERGQMKLAPADLSGVRLLLKALKRGETIGILPDQVPSNGEGEWLPFFGRPAYTMTLIARLTQSSGAGVLMCHVERLPRGKGYIMRYKPLSFDMSSSVSQQVNVALEDVVRSCPEQYLWSYNRYKIPRGVLPPEAIKEQ